MSTQYRDPPKWKQNAAQSLDVELFQRMQAASTLCDRIVQASNLQLQLGREHVEAGGDFLEVLVGTEKYEKIRAAAEAEEAAARAPKVEAPAEVVPEAAPEVEAPKVEKKEPKRKYMPRLNASPFYVLAVRAMELQEELAPLVHALGQHLVDAGVDVRRLNDEEIIAEVIRNEFGVDVEEISPVEYDLMCDTLRKSQEWLQQFRREHADEIRLMEGRPDPGEAGATDG
jgi:hypothetical protein